MNIKYVPNILSTIRIFLVPIFIIAFFMINRYVALAIFVLASITDLIDGFIARKYNAITEFGKVLDPLADKLMKLSALIVLTIVDLLPLWITILMALCDLAMIISGICIYKKHITIPSNWVGKLGTLVISLGVVLSFFTQWIGDVNVYVVYAGITIAIISGLNYVNIFFTKKLKERKDKKCLNNKNEIENNEE